MLQTVLNVLIDLVIGWQPVAAHKSAGEPKAADTGSAGLRTPRVHTDDRRT